MKEWVLHLVQKEIRIQADSVQLTDCGALAILDEAGKLKCAYAPGTWVRLEASSNVAADGD